MSTPSTPSTLSIHGLLIELFEFDGEDFFILRRPLNFWFNDTQITIPDGFVSDGCSLPRFFWRTIGHPLRMDYLEEAIRHDYLYKYQPCTRKEADVYFYNILMQKGLYIRARLIYRGVRWFGWIAWREHKRNLKELK